MPQSFDWTHLQTLVAVAEHGSLSGAARALGGSQPTMGRHIGILEQDLGVRLFERTAHGLELTPTGIELVEHARHMSDAADALALTAMGRSQAIAGTVRVTASDIVATYILPEILTALHLEEPEINIELVSSDQTDNLLQREADIAVRMYRPTQSDVFTKKVGELHLGLFATPSYIERKGRPTSFADIRNHDFVGYDRNDIMIRGFRAAGLDVDRDFFCFRCDNQVVVWKMVVAGYGLGFNQVQIGQADPRVVQIDLEVELPTLPFWLTSHSELKSSRRVRRVYDFLADRLDQFTLV